MPMQGRRIILRQDVDIVVTGIQTIADRNIYQAILSRKGNSRLAALFRQRV